MTCGFEAHASSGQIAELDGCHGGGAVTEDAAPITPARVSEQQPTTRAARATARQRSGERGADTTRGSFSPRRPKPARARSWATKGEGEAHGKTWKRWVVISLLGAGAAFAQTSGGTSGSSQTGSTGSTGSTYGGSGSSGATGSAASGHDAGYGYGSGGTGTGGSSMGGSETSSGTPGTGSTGTTGTTGTGSTGSTGTTGSGTTTETPRALGSPAAGTHWRGAAHLSSARGVWSSQSKTYSPSDV